MTSSVMTRKPRRLACDDEAAEILDHAEVGIDRAVVGDVIAVVAAGAKDSTEAPTTR